MLCKLLPLPPIRSSDTSAGFSLQNTVHVVSSNLRDLKPHPAHRIKTSQAPTVSETDGPCPDTPSSRHFLSAPPSRPAPPRPPFPERRPQTDTERRHAPLMFLRERQPADLVRPLETGVSDTCSHSPLNTV